MGVSGAPNFRRAAQGCFSNVPETLFFLLQGFASFGPKTSVGRIRQGRLAARQQYERPT
jgi:hypothetical protein